MFTYLDNNATTHVAPEVVDAMLPFLRDLWGNPSSAYSFGHRVSEPIEHARSHVARLINCDLRDIVFTSCGTESNNTAIQSALLAQPAKKHILTTAVEHSANIKYCQALESRGYDVTYLPVNAAGALDLDQLHASIRPDTAIVSVMWANNETGILFPVPRIATICRDRGVLFHTDAVQLAGKLPIDVASTGIDMLSLSAHKLHAPKGIGALYVRRKLDFHPYLVGGAQEGGRRAGTENVPYIVAFGVAARMAIEKISIEAPRLTALRDRMESELLRIIPGATRNGAAEPRLPNTSNLSFEAVEAEGVLMLLDQAGIYASSGSACTTGSLTPSHVLTSLGLKPDQARSSIRLSLGRYNTDQDVDRLIATLPGIIARLRYHLPRPVSF